MVPLLEEVVSTMAGGVWLPTIPSHPIRFEEDVTGAM
jgi:hypothetical protein